MLGSVYGQLQGNKKNGIHKVVFPKEYLLKVSIYCVQVLLVSNRQESQIKIDRWVWTPGSEGNHSIAVAIPVICCICAVALNGSVWCGAVRDSVQ